jgi:hypothetical protein
MTTTFPGGEICLATALCDPEAELLPKARQLWPALQATFPTQAVHVTDDTHPDWLAFLRAQKVPIRTSAPAWDHIGLHRRRSLEIALENFDTENVVNHVHSLITECSWDLMMAARCFSRAAAELIVRDCREDTLGRVYAANAQVDAMRPYLKKQQKQGAD